MRKKNMQEFVWICYLCEEKSTKEDKQKLQVVQQVFGWNSD